MFNAYIHDKLLTKAKIEENNEEKQLKVMTVQAKMRESLARKNLARIERRILEMSIDPVPIQVKKYSKSPDIKIDRYIRQKPKDTKERLKDAEVKNTWLDTIPILPFPHDFRPRKKDKEINSNMKFTPRDRYERVADTWELQHKILNSSWMVNDKILTENCEKFPNTFRKSYYKTLESVALNVSPVLRNPNFPSVYKRLPDGSEENTHKTLTEIAKEAMEKCKLKPSSAVISQYHSRSSSLH